jgi:hypothetical protein
MVLASIAGTYIVQNTDSSAPIAQLLLLDRGLVDGMRELRLARIPSFFPDLLAIWMLMKMGGWGDTTVILLAKYAMLMGSLLVGLQAWLLVIGAGLSRWSALLASLSGTFLLFWRSSLYREMLGIALTPLHHGGNLISTMLAIGIFPMAIGRLSRGKGKVAWALFLVLVAVASASNVLFLFTACMPLLIGCAWILLRSSGNRLPMEAAVVAGSLRSVNRMVMVVSLPLAAAAGILAGRLFNLQCVSPIQTLALSNLFAEYRHSHAFLLATLAAFTLLVTSFLALRSSARCIVGLVVALSALSPFLYTILLPDLAPRYLLILIMLTVVMVCLLPRVAELIRFGLAVGPASPSSTHPSVRKRWFVREQLHAILVLSLLGLYLIGPCSSLAARNYTVAYEKRFPLDGLAAELLIRLNHSTGLSDFWGANIGMLSRGRLDVQPIHSNGEPDLWAHNREAFLANPRGRDAAGGLLGEPSHPAQDDSLAVKNYSFVYLREEEGNGLSEADILRSYGKPAQRIGCRKGVKDLCIFLYDDSRRLQEVIRGKLQRFKNHCVAFQNDR